MFEVIERGALCCGVLETEYVSPLRTEAGAPQGAVGVGNRIQLDVGNPTLGPTISSRPVTHHG